MLYNDVFYATSTNVFSAFRGWWQGFPFFPRSNVVSWKQWVWLSASGAVLWQETPALWGSSALWDWCFFLQGSFIAKTYNFSSKTWFNQHISSYQENLQWNSFLNFVVAQHTGLEDLNMKIDKCKKVYYRYRKTQRSIAEVTYLLQRAYKIRPEVTKTVLYWWQQLSCE